MRKVDRRHDSVEMNTNMFFHGLFVAKSSRNPEAIWTGGSLRIESHCSRHSQGRLNIVTLVPRNLSSLARPEEDILPNTSACRTDL